MKINIDEAIEILKDYIKLDREIREGDTESDYSKFCEKNVSAIESLIEYVFASRCAFKTSSVISKQVKDVEDTKVVQLTETDLKKMLACLGSCLFIASEDLSKEERSILLSYSYELGYVISDILGIENYDDTRIDINTLEIEELS